MPLKLQYKARVEGGSIKMGPRMRKRMEEEVAQAFHEKALTITVEKQRKTRSDSQNAYYWGVVIPVFLVLLLS